MTRPTFALALLMVTALVPTACASAGGVASHGNPDTAGAPATPGESGNPAVAPAPPASGHLYRNDGSPAGVGDVIALALERDVLFMGELHGDPAAHALQLELLDALIAASGSAGREIVLSLEMFERDVQP